MTDRKPHLSPTQLDLATKCGEAYRRRYIEGDRIPPGVAAHRGKGLHAGAEENFRQKIESFADLPASDIVDAAVAAFETACQSDGYTLSDDEAARGARVILAEGADTTAELAKAYADHQAPAHQPLLVEEPLRIEMPGDHDLFGVVDLVSINPVEVEIERPSRRVVDIKSASRKKSQDDADSSTQLTFYAAATHLYFEQPADEVMLDVLVQRKGGVERQVLTSTRGESDYDALVERVAMVERAIKAGVFMPATPGAWWCSPRWCGFYSTCKFVRRT